ncbi:MAG: ATP synthase F0 subunit B, partial [Deltaproteobacteria bacterium]|nr:ATP synthase F0 subunit B [Deltaproteobacteria bacterium]
MRTLKKTGWRPVLFSALVIIGVGGLACDALAAEASPNWRSIYDMAMKWLNFGILTFFIVKFGKTPLKNFLALQKAELANQISLLETQKSSTSQKIEDARKMLAEGDQRLAALKDKMIRKGEKEKGKIINSARTQSRMIIEGTKRKVENQLNQAKRNFRSEMIDMAVSTAMARL